MNTSPFVSLLLSLAIALASLGYANTASAAKDKNCKVEPFHPSCKPDNEPPNDPPGLPVCLAPPCIASVGKWHKKPARDYAEFSGGIYTELSHGQFGDILAALPGDTFDALCKAYNVLVFEWNTPNIKNLSWRSLENYMTCGGGIIFEDPTNVDALTDGVLTAEIYVHDKTGLFGTIAFDSNCITDEPTLCNPAPYSNDSVGFPYAFDITNNHMVFKDPENQPTTTTLVTLVPFLRLPSLDDSGAVLGLYGELTDSVHGVLGRIVFTGPDNNFHGDRETTDTDPNDEADKNQYDLLFDEINWLLDKNLVPPLEE